MGIIIIMGHLNVCVLYLMDLTDIYLVHKLLTAQGPLPPCALKPIPSLLVNP